MLSYAELSRRADRLAALLRFRGLRDEDVVAVLPVSRLEAVVALVAVLRSGGVYLPLDRCAPPERTELVLRDSGARFVLVSPEAQADPDFCADRDDLIRCPLTPAALDVPEPTDSWPRPHREQAAYLIYTSGSSGTPKGVCVSHGALSRHVRGAADRFGLRAEDRVLQFAAPHVDVALEQTLAPLWAGAAVVVRDSELLTTQEFLDWLALHGVTVANLPAGYWNELANGLELVTWPRRLRLRMMISGSDRMSPGAVDIWRRTAARTIALLNAYGPTEAVITSAIHELPMVAEPRDRDNGVPIGTPVGQRRLYVLGPSLEPCPPGVAGELYIGGEELARGYAGRGGLTAACFVPDVFGGAGGRLYRTGDVVRLRGGADGDVLEFVGRVDDQVKVRGFRVEPGEVEALLSGHPGVVACVVVGAEGRLVAYVVAAPGVSVEELREFVGGRLPEYMVPSGWVLVDELPLTPAGKVDRTRLPEPVFGVSSGDSDHVGPRSAVEELLVGVWGEVLGVERVGVFDNFFQLGGDSLSAVRVVTRLLPIYGSSASPYAIFETRNLAEFAAALEERTREGQDRLPELTARQEPVAGPAPAPLSFGQQALWFMDRWDPDAPTYNVPWVFELSGRLDPGVLAECLRTIVGRHEVLRSVFPASLGEPTQVVRAEPDVTTELTDVSGLSADESTRVVEKVVRAEAVEPFDLERGPLLRAHLIQTAVDECTLVVVFHHIVWDEWSRRVFEAELAELYAAATEERLPRLPELAVQYRDYARWQREIVQDDVLRAQLSYWKGRLADAPALLRLPTNRQRPAIQTFAGASTHFRLPAEVSSAVRSLCRAESATPFMVLLAAFVALLHRYTGDRDLVVGTPAATRTRSELENLIGYFVNILPLRLDVTPCLSFRDLLHHVRDVALGAYRHQEVPFEVLVDHLRAERTLDQMPLVQVIFEMHAEDPKPVRLGEVSATRRLVPTGTSKFDMTWSVYDEGDLLRGWIEFNADLFDVETVEAMAVHYERLLCSLVEDPARTIGSASFLTSTEVETLGRWSRSAGEAPAPAFGTAGSCVHELIAEQAARTPDAIAVQSDAARLSYRELDRRASMLADRLVAAGIRPDVPVGVCLERSPELVTALLAVLKAGGAYVPLDPSLPVPRLRLMLDETAAPVVLTREHLRHLLHEVRADILSIDGKSPAAAAVERLTPAQLRPDNAAYIMYTSGSTGRPKGVVVPHRAVTTRLLGMQGAFALSPVDVVLHKTTFAFDVSVWELLWPLVAGARLVLARPDGQRDNEYLIGLIRSANVTTLHFVPSVLQQFLEHLDAGTCGSIRRVLTGGEPLSGVVRRRCLEIWPEAELHHLYGPTETCIDVTAWECRPEHRGEQTPIGYPVAGTHVWVVDSAGQLAPPGIPGELCVGGPQLARGYVGHPELTAECFVPDGFGDEATRLYRTGDVVRFGPGGVLEFVGRVDDQVKVRGYRVEPGEVEAVIRSHPGVTTCAVVGVEGRLVAYVVTGSDVPARELRRFAGEWLPEYMVPSGWVFEDALPLTPAGKVDRVRLPAPAFGAGSAGPGGGVGGAEPRSVIEELVAGVWRDVLGVERVGVFDNFFQLGGDSFTAVKVSARIGAALQLKVPTTLVFRAPTVAEATQRLVDGATSVESLETAARTALMSRASSREEHDRFLRQAEEDPR